MEIRMVQEEINRSKRFGLSFGVLAVEVNNSVPRGLSKVMPGKTLSFHLMEKNLRGYDRIIGPVLRRYFIILPQAEKGGVAVVKQRIHDIAKREKWGDISIGAALYPENGNNAKALIERAISELA